MPNNLEPHEFSRYSREDFKDSLMLLVTAGADVYAIDKFGYSVSDIACSNGHEEIWIEVLAECGYNPEEVFSLEEDYPKLQEQFGRGVPGLGVFSTMAPAVRATRLSFAEYSHQRKALSCVRKIELEERNYSRWEKEREAWQASKIVLEDDSDDYEEEESEDEEVVYDTEDDEEIYGSDEEEMDGSDDDEEED